MSRRKPGFWNTYPQWYWAEADWKAWAKAGRPRIPVGMRLSSQPRAPRLDQVPTPAPLHPLPDVDWFGKARPRAARRGPANPKVDQMLAKLGIR